MVRSVLATTMCAPLPGCSEIRSPKFSISFAIIGFAIAILVRKVDRKQAKPLLIGASLRPRTSDHDLDPTPSAATTISAVTFCLSLRTTFPFSSVSKYCSTFVEWSNWIPSSCTYEHSCSWSSLRLKAKDSFSPSPKGQDPIQLPSYFLT